MKEIRMKRNVSLFFILIASFVFTIIFSCSPDVPGLGNDANLSGITLSQGELEPPFSPSTSSYKILIEDQYDTLTVTPALSDSDADYVIKKGVNVSANPIAMEYGLNTVSIDVTAEDGVTKKTYTLEIGRGIEDNYATLEISGISLMSKVYIISGSGYDIERIPGTSGGHPSDQMGYGREHALVFETANNPDVTALQNWHDTANSDPVNNEEKDISIIVSDVSGAEIYRWIFFHGWPDSYEPGFSGRMRFTWRNMRPADRVDDNIASWYYAGTDYQANNDTYDTIPDQGIEISGVSTGRFPNFTINETDRTITLFFTWYNGAAIVDWTNNYVEGVEPKRDMSIITYSDPSNLSTETERCNYYGVFVTKFCQQTGWGLYTKTKAMLVVSYDFWEIP